MRIKAGVVLAVGLLVLSCAAVWAADFSADVIMEGPMGVMESRVYAREGALRQESAGPMGRTAMITWEDRDLSVLLMLDQNSYMEFGEDDDEPGLGMPDMDDFADFQEGEGVTRLGSEEIEGFSCEKFLIVDPEMPDGKTTVWISRELQFPLRVVYESPEGSMTMKCRNIVRKTPAASLFEVPRGYEKLQVPWM